MIDNLKGDTINDMSDTKNSYLTGDVAKRLGMATTTVRKYSQSLESKGYSFTKGKNTGKRQARLFTEKDITVLRYLKEVREETNITVERATSIVIERFGKGTTQSTLPNNRANTTNIERYDPQDDELKKMINNQSELLVNQSKLILELTARLDEQEEYINKQVDFKLNEAIEQAQEIEASKPDETIKKVEEAPKEIQSLKNIKVPKPKETAKEIEEEIKEVQMPEEIEEKPKESSSRISKKDKEKSLFSRFLSKLIIDNRKNK